MQEKIKTNKKNADAKSNPCAESDETAHAVINNLVSDTLNNPKKEDNEPSAEENTIVKVCKFQLDA